MVCTYRRALRAVVASIAVVAIAPSYAGAEFGALIAPGGSATATSSGRVTFGSSPTIACNVTLTMSLLTNPAIGLESGEVVGDVDSVSIRECAGGSVSAVLGLPWAIEVWEGLGTLPDEAVGVRLEVDQVAFNLSVFGGFVNCLYGGTAEAVLILDGEDPYLADAFALEEEVPLPFVRGGGLCPDEGALSGTFSITPQEVAIGDRGNPYIVSKRSVDFGEVSRDVEGSRTIRIGIEPDGAGVTIDRVRVIGAEGIERIFIVEPGFRVDSGTTVPLDLKFRPNRDAGDFRATIELKEGDRVIWRFDVVGRGRP